MASKKDMSEIRQALEGNRIAVAEVLAVTKSNAQKLESFQASLDFASSRIDSLEKTALPALKSNIDVLESDFKQQLLVAEARSMQYNLVFINPPSSKFAPTENKKKARHLIQLCGISSERSGSISLRRSHPLPRRNIPGDTRQQSASFIVAFNSWEEKEMVLASARSHPPSMKDMKVVSQWPRKKKKAHALLKTSTEFNAAKQQGSQPYVKINFRCGTV